MLGINTNIASLTSQRNLFRSGASLQTSIQRLSSGLRINSARDDAAGLAISERMNGQIRGFEVAKRNSGDGISGLQVADGVLGSIGDNLQRMRELSVQAATGTLSESDRANLELEFSQLSDEVQRLTGTAEFNGVSLLDGSKASFDIQIGADGAPADNQLAINFTNIAAEVDTFQDGNVTDLTAGNFANTGAIAIAALDASATAVANADLSQAEKDAFAAFGGNGTTVTANDFDLDGNGTNDLRVYSDGATFAYSEVDSKGQVSGDLTETVALPTTLADIGLVSQTAAALGTTGTQSFTFGNAKLELASDGTEITKSTAQTFIGGVDGSNAQNAITKLDTLLDEVNNQRATLGAGINRLEAVIANLDSSIVNLSAARGRIVDADFARETANLTRTQILQQAGTAVLAQSNQLPANVLALLG